MRHVNSYFFLPGFQYKAESYTVIAYTFFPTCSIFSLFSSAFRRISKCTRLGRFDNTLTKDVAEKNCKAMNAINVYRYRYAGTWCSLTDYFVSVQTKSSEWMAWQKMQVVTLLYHKRKWGFYGTDVGGREHVNTENKEWDKDRHFERYGWHRSSFRLYGKSSNR